MESTGGLEEIVSVAQISSIDSVQQQKKGARCREIGGQMERLAAKCKKQWDDSEVILREVVLAPSTIVMIAGDDQLGILSRFCTVSPGAIMSVDGTFHVGDYFVTIISTRHLMLETRRSHGYPVVLCAVFLHHHKDAHTYRRIASMLLCSCPQLADLRVLGTDGEEVQLSEPKSST